MEPRVTGAGVGAGVGAWVGDLVGPFVGGRVGVAVAHAWVPHVYTPLLKLELVFLHSEAPSLQVPILILPPLPHRVSGKLS